MYDCDTLILSWIACVLKHRETEEKKWHYLIMPNPCFFQLKKRRTGTYNKHRKKKENVWYFIQPKQKFLSGWSIRFS